MDIAILDNKTGKFYLVLAKPTALLQEVINVYCAQRNLHTGDVTFSHNGARLDLARSLEELGLKSKDVLCCEYLPHAACIRIALIPSAHAVIPLSVWFEEDGSYFHFQAATGVRLATALRVFLSYKGLPEDSVFFTYAGWRLNLSRTVADCGLQHQDVIWCFSSVNPMRELPGAVSALGHGRTIPVFVTGFGGGAPNERFRIRTSATLGEVLTAYMKHKGLDPDGFFLTCAGTYVNLKLTVSELGLQRNDLLFYAATKPLVPIELLPARAASYARQLRDASRGVLRAQDERPLELEAAIMAAAACVRAVCTWAAHPLPYDPAVWPGDSDSAWLILGPMAADEARVALLQLHAAAIRGAARDCCKGQGAAAEAGSSCEYSALLHDTTWLLHALLLPALATAPGPDAVQAYPVAPYRHILMHILEEPPGSRLDVRQPGVLHAVQQILALDVARALCETDTLACVARVFAAYGTAAQAGSGAVATRHGPAADPGNPSDAVAALLPSASGAGRPRSQSTADPLLSPDTQRQLSLLPAVLLRCSERTIKQPVTPALGLGWASYFARQRRDLRKRVLRALARSNVLEHMARAHSLAAAQEGVIGSCAQLMTLGAFDAKYDFLLGPCLRFCVLANAVAQLVAIDGGSPCGLMPEVIAGCALAEAGAERAADQRAAALAAKAVKVAANERAAAWALAQAAAAVEARAAEMKAAAAADTAAAELAAEAAHAAAAASAGASASAAARMVAAARAATGAQAAVLPGARLDAWAAVAASSATLAVAAEKSLYQAFATAAEAARAAAAASVAARASVAAAARAEVEASEAAEAAAAAEARASRAEQAAAHARTHTEDVAAAGAAGCAQEESSGEAKAPSGAATWLRVAMWSLSEAPCAAAAVLPLQQLRRFCMRVARAGLDPAVPEVYRISVNALTAAAAVQHAGGDCRMPRRFWQGVPAALRMLLNNRPGPHGMIIFDVASATALITQVTALLPREGREAAMVLLRAGCIDALMISLCPSTGARLQVRWLHAVTNPGLLLPLMSYGELEEVTFLLLALPVVLRAAQVRGLQLGGVAASASAPAGPALPAHVGSLLVAHWLPLVKALGPKGCPPGVRTMVELGLRARAREGSAGAER